MMRLIYLNDGLSSVFHSQVAALLNWYQQQGWFSEVILITAYNHQEEREKIRSRISAKIPVLFFRLAPNYPFFNFVNIMRLRRCLSRVNPADENTIIHIRGGMLALYYAGTGNKYFFPARTLVDMRGTSYEEVELYFKLPFFLKKLKLSNVARAYCALNLYPFLSAVSYSLKQYLQEKVNVSSQIEVIPSLCGENFIFDRNQREKIRKELQLDDGEILLVFSSAGMASWQNDFILEKIKGEKIKVLNLSKKKKEAKHIITLFVSYEQMPAYLAAADGALLFRNGDVVNRVASPVKFSEYVCMGLPVITNGTIEAVNDFIRKYQAGLIVNNMHEVNEEKIKKLCLTADREKIAMQGKKEYSLQTVAEKYVLLYKTMTGQ